MLSHFGIPFLYWLREKSYDFYTFVDDWVGLLE